MKKAKQIIAIIAIVLLIGLYIATLITAIFAKEQAATAFTVCMILTVVIPLMAFIAILFFGRAYGKKVIGDPEPISKDGGTDDGAEASAEDFTAVNPENSEDSGENDSLS